MPIREPSRYHPDRLAATRIITDAAASGGQKSRLGDLIRWRLVLYFICEGCSHSALADLGKLADKAGYDRRLAELCAKARCSRCGGAKVRPMVKPANL